MKPCSRTRSRSLEKPASRAVPPAAERDTVQTEVAGLHAIGEPTTSNRWMFDGLHAIGGGVHEIWRQRNDEARERRQKKIGLGKIQNGWKSYLSGLCKFIWDFANSHKCKTKNA